jgi:hypothetical protein
MDCKPLLNDGVPRVAALETHQRSLKFLLFSRKRLFQHYLPKGDIAAWPKPHLILSLSDVAFAGFKGGNDGGEFLDILAGFGF